MEIFELKCATRWNELDWDSLVRYHSIPKGEPLGAGEDDGVGELMVKMQEFEVTSGMRIVGLGCSPVPILPKGEGKEGIEEKMRWLEEELGEMGSCVWMKRYNDIAAHKSEVGGRWGNQRTLEGVDGEAVYVMPRGEFVRVVREATAWMEKKEGLLKLPEKWVVIDGETFALPDFIGDDDRVVRYGQYGDAQMYMMGIMGIVSKWEPSGAGGRSERRPSSADLERLGMYRNGFLSTLLLPTVLEKREDGSERRRVLRYDSNEREHIADKMEKAPMWLFSLLWHLVQGCLAYYHGRFPDLVSGGKASGRKNTDMYVAKLGTDNAVMKYAGYPNVEAVKNEPVGVILERLDAMAKESKEWEKAKRKK